jgi:hypothetical protein
MKTSAARSEWFVSPVAHRGTVVGFDAEGSPLVRGIDTQAPVPCDVIDSGMGPPEYVVGDQVVFAVYADDVRRACLLGRVIARSAADAPIRRRSLRLDVDTFEVVARDRATVQTAGARIRLTRQGDLEFLAQTLLARARRLQKLLAPILRLN